MFKLQSNPDVLEALEALSGTPAGQIRSHTGEHPTSGEAIYEAGYKLHDAGFLDASGKAAPMVTFQNGLNQTVQVPAHRITEWLESATTPNAGPAADPVSSPLA